MPLCMLCDAFCGVPARATHAYRCARRSRATAASNAPIASARRDRRRPRDLLRLRQRVTSPGKLTVRPSGRHISGVAAPARFTLSVRHATPFRQGGSRVRAGAGGAADRMDLASDNRA